jgi:hypothetical protein
MDKIGKLIKQYFMTMPLSWVCIITLLISLVGLTIAMITLNVIWIVPVLIVIFWGVVHYFVNEMYCVSVVNVNDPHQFLIVESVYGDLARVKKIWKDSLVKQVWIVTVPDLMISREKCLVLNLFGLDVKTTIKISVFLDLPDQDNFPTAKLAEIYKSGSTLKRWILDGYEKKIDDDAVFKILRENNTIQAKNKIEEMFADLWNFQPIEGVAFASIRVVSIICDWGHAR